jgi:predicted 2-oxoglutarate/Fe(II)-dependent dioxygenase YbiX
MNTPTKESQMRGDTLAFTPDLAWDSASVKVSTIDVSKWERSDKYVKVLSNILTKQECADLIQTSEASGYEPAKVNTGIGEVLMTDVRNNDRCIIDSPITMEFIWQRLVTVCGDDANLMQASFAGRDLHAVGLNERMRILRYDSGTYFAPHNDGSYQRRRDADERQREYSCVTFQLYLNEGFTGGATRLLNCRDESEGYDVVPEAGSVLLFQHNVYHEGALLEEGRKYCLRTDVMYTQKGSGHEYATYPIHLK